MIPCNRCGAPTQPGQRFCEQCGAPAAPIAAPPGSFAALSGPPSGGSRRPATKILIPAVVVVVVAVLVAAVVVLRRGDGGNASPSGRSDDGQYSVVGQGPTTEPREQWSERIDCGSICALGVGDDTVYVASSTSKEVEVEAFDAASGSSRWKQRLAVRGGVFGVLPYERRVLLVGGEGVVAIDPIDGERVWKSKLRWTGYVGDGVAYLSDLSEAATTAAVSVEDGKERWSEDGRLEGVCDGVAYLNDDRRIVARDAASGEQRWKRAIASAVLTCGGGAVLVGDGDDLRRLDSDDGTDLWSKPIDEVPNLVADGLVLVDAGEGCEGVAVDDGSRRWRSDDFPCSLFLVGDHHAIGGEVRGDTLLVDLGAGKRLDRVRSRIADDESTVTALGQNLYVEFGEEQLHALRYDGDQFSDAWTIDIDPGIRSVELNDGRVFTQTDRKLTAYR